MLFSTFAGGTYISTTMQCTFIWKLCPINMLIMQTKEWSYCRLGGNSCRFTPTHCEQSGGHQLGSHIDQEMAMPRNSATISGTLSFMYTDRVCAQEPTTVPCVHFEWQFFAHSDCLEYSQVKFCLHWQLLLSTLIFLRCRSFGLIVHVFYYFSMLQWR